MQYYLMQFILLFELVLYENGSLVHTFYDRQYPLPQHSLLFIRKDVMKHRIPPPPPSLKGAEMVAVYPSLLRIFDLHSFYHSLKSADLKTPKKEVRTFRNICKNIQIPNCEISLASFQYLIPILFQLNNTRLGQDGQMMAELRSRLPRSTLFASIDRHEVHQKNSPFAWMITIKTRIHFVFSFMLKFDNPSEIQICKRKQNRKGFWKQQYNYNDVIFTEHFNKFTDNRNLAKHRFCLRKGIGGHGPGSVF